jgi:hypothetical protein
MSREARERGALIDSILGTRTRWGGGGGVGVYGADVCALCGAVDTYRGWIMAAYGCHFEPHGEFVCSACRDRLIPRDVTSISERKRRVRAALSESRVRYCRICESRIERDPRWGAKGSGTLARLCSGCRSRLDDEDLSDDDPIVKQIRLRVRRRYLELLPPGELAEMAGTVVAMREELDSMDETARRGRDPR